MSKTFKKLQSWGVPGYRSANRWKQLVASISYIVLAFWLLQVLVGRVGLAVFALAILATVWLALNAWNLRSRVPLLSSSSRGQHLAGWAVLGLILLFSFSWSQASPAAPIASVNHNTGVGGGSSTTQPQALATSTAEPTATKSSATPSPTPTTTPTATPAAKTVATQAPAPTHPATPAPTQAPAPPPAAFVSFPNGAVSASPGQTALLSVATTPNSACSIEVDYYSGPSHAQGLVPKTSDAAGRVSWAWIVGTRTTPGQWPITVTCGSASGQTYINVV